MCITSMICGNTECEEGNEDPINVSRTLASTPSSSTSGCISGDDTWDGKSTIPPSLISVANCLSISEDGPGLTSVEELTKAVEQCKDMVLESPERSEERKWLVRRLIELRLRLQEARDVAEELTCSPREDIKVRLGHHFVFQNQPVSASKQYCDRCCGAVWSVIQSWYQCRDCLYVCHTKCLAQVCRICAHVIASENPQYIKDICPEVGLSAQSYRCAECKTHITFTFPKGLTCFGRPFTSENSWVEPRLCDYDGCYYCPSCHWNSMAVIPARVIHNWDFEERPVCRASRQLLQLMIKRPLLNLEELNPRLFGFVEELGFVKKMREDIMIMKKYFISCKDATEQRLLWQLKDYNHFIDNVDTYSLQDLIDTNSGRLPDRLSKIHAEFTKHIKEECKVCYGRGYVCELCEEDQVIFPFDSSAVSCIKCSTVFHRNCWSRKNQQCPKCLRLEERAKQKDASSDSD
ncbi:differentially expressed in FDCP 8 homolog A isoform X1 [Schistocerca piceifrons]|uniref:differentially expressed in FDCP 8 homolog A isoform X1 n=1 Tax=Schistocerca piceifrons TaxID=274613 RepID=UPI001F5E4EF3|nr:differentially expressed in FDCP 8 homolog A isoform X1 [Schistocerca piceifrons]